MKASIFVEGLRIKAFHGMSPQERKIGNMFEVSVALDYPPAVRAAKSDSLQDTINYAEIVNLIKAEMSIPSDLIENVAGRIHRSLTEAFPAITGGWIKISKIAPPIAAELDSVSVRLKF